jgi:hypothetical protein
MGRGRPRGRPTPGSPVPAVTFTKIFFAPSIEECDALHVAQLVVAWARARSGAARVLSRQVCDAERREERAGAGRLSTGCHRRAGDRAEPGRPAGDPQVRTRRGLRNREIQSEADVESVSKVLRTWLQQEARAGCGYRGGCREDDWLHFSD